ncbi:MAG: cyclic nucleotide-binding domain-containing protein [Spirochaetales bacterium]|nr:cyclic nucleotide-binding domain-containing protein [Spirochaetales bacterium]
MTGNENKSIFTKTYLPGNAILIEIKDFGRIQFGIPSETIKDTIAGGLPHYYVAPMIPLALDLSNKAAIEFIMFTYYITKQKATIIVNDENCLSYFMENSELALNPRTEFFPTKMEKYYKNSPEYTPDILKESIFLGKNPMVEQLINFMSFDKQGKIVLEKKYQDTLSHSITIFHNQDNNYTLIDNHSGQTEKVRIRITPYKSFSHVSTIEKYHRKLKLPLPDLGSLRNVYLTISSGSGFSPLDKSWNFRHAFGTTNCGAVFGDKGKITIIDPIVNTFDFLIHEKINPAKINSIFLSHIHDDHIAGFMQLYFALPEKVSVYISENNKMKLLRLIYNNIQRMISEEDIEKSFKWLVFEDLSIDSGTKKPHPTRINGLNWYFFCSFHSIETYGFWIEDDKGLPLLYWSGDSQLDPDIIHNAVKQGIMSGKRAELLLYLPLCDNYFIENDQPPLHTTDAGLKRLLELNNISPAERHVYTMHSATPANIENVKLALPGMIIHLCKDAGRFDGKVTEAIEIGNLIKLVPSLRAITRDTDSFLAIIEKLTLVEVSGLMMEKGALADSMYFYVGGGCGHIVTGKPLDDRELNQIERQLLSGREELDPRTVIAFRYDIGTVVGEGMLDAESRRSHYVYALANGNDKPRYLKLDKADMEDIINNTNTPLAISFRRYGKLRKSNIIPRGVGNSPLFAALPVSEIERILNDETLTSALTYPPGTSIIEQGRKVSHIFVLTNGLISITKFHGEQDEKNRGKTVLKEISAETNGPQVFGEMSLVEMIHRQKSSLKTGIGLAKANVEAVTEVRVLAINRSFCLHLIRENFAVARSLMNLANVRKNENLRLEKEKQYAIDEIHMAVGEFNLALEEPGIGHMQRNKDGVVGPLEESLCDEEDAREEE